MDYGNLKVPENVTPEVQAILDSYEARNKEIENAHRKEMAKLYGGAALQIGSALIPGTLGLKAAGGAIKALTPYVGKKIAENVATGTISGLASGAVEGLGRGLMEGENPLKTMLQDSAIGLVGGSALGAGAGTVSRAIDKYNNPWFVDESLQKGKNALKYVYDKFIPKSEELYQQGLPKVGTKEVVQNLRMESGLPNGRGAYTQRSYSQPRDGVIAQYYPTEEIKEAFKVRNFNTPKFNELTPNDDTTAKLYYDTLKGVKDEFGKRYDTVSLYPQNEYKDMRLFLSPDKLSGFAIKPDGDIVSVFSAKKGGGTSHSMLELALQNKGYKLDNYDVPDLRNIYENHGFNVTERYPWSDEYWDPKEWDKDFMLKEYGIGEPDITYRQIYDKNIYPEIQQTKLFEKIMDAFQ